MKSCSILPLIFILAAFQTAEASSRLSWSWAKTAGSLGFTIAAGSLYYAQKTDTLQNPLYHRIKKQRFDQRWTQEDFLVSGINTKPERDASFIEALLVFPLIEIAPISEQRFSKYVTDGNIAEAVKAILSGRHRANHLKESLGHTALSIAVLNNDLAMAFWLMKAEKAMGRGAPAHCSLPTEFFFFAMGGPEAAQEAEKEDCYGDQFFIIKEFPTHRRSTFKSPLAHAIKQGNSAMIRLLIEEGRSYVAPCHIRAAYARGLKNEDIHYLKEIEEQQRRHHYRPLPTEPANPPAYRD